MVKRCPEHGEFTAVVWRGEPAFSSWVRPKIPFGGGPREPVGKGCPYDCGLCARHSQRTCTALVEITTRCNLGCPVCFADSSGTGEDLDHDTLARMFDQVMQRNGRLQPAAFGRRAHSPVGPAGDRGHGRQGGLRVRADSTHNGLRLAEDPELAGVLAGAGLSSIFLQFDGVRDEVYRTCAAAT